MPLTYGGGIKTLEQAGRIFRLGVEKSALIHSVPRCFDYKINGKKIWKSEHSCFH